MNYSIRQTDTGWELVDGDGVVVLSTTTADRDGYTEMVTALSRLVDDLLELAAATTPADTDPANATDDGLLPEVWTSETGICFSELLASGRDFTEVTWSWRDPGTTAGVQLMMQTQTDIGHFGAQWAGYATELRQADGTCFAVGRFFDNDAGIQARDMMLSRSVGVSVDPSENWTAHTECDEVDDWDYCVASRMVFEEYEIAGVTITPFPAFENATIQLEGSGVNAGGAERRELAALAAGGHLAAPARPPRDWFYVAEPALGSDLLVEQLDEDGGHVGWAVPLTITDDGRVFGHLGVKGTCHTGFEDVCVTIPSSPTSYARFHVGATMTAEDETIPTGVLVAGGNHAGLNLSADQLRAYHEDVSLQWADVRAVDGTFGPWCSGALRPDVTEDLLRVLRASSLSGEWRDEGRGLDLILAQCVNNPGFPVFREAAGLAAGGRQITITAKAETRVRMAGGGRVLALSASGAAKECKDCGHRQASRRRARGAEMTGAQGDRMLELLETIERRTRPMNDAAAAALVASATA